MDSHDNPCTNLDSLTTWHLRCVNCGVNVTKLQRHLLEIAEVRNLIQQWVQPQQVQVASDSLVCHSCWTSAWNQIRHPTSEQQNAPIVGHRHVCISCGRSLLRIRSHLLRSDSPREERIRNVIAHLIAPRKLPSSSHVCHRCWRRTDLKALRSTAEIEPLKSASSSSLPSQLPQPSTSSTPRVRKEKIQAEPAEELPNDMENDVQDRVMGTVSQERMKKGCVSTKFECQSDTTTHTLTKPSRVAKKRRKLLNEEREEELEEKNVPNTHSEVASTLSSDETTDSATSSEINQRIQDEVPEEERDDPVVASKCYKIIANVYGYLQKEYESLKSQLEAICDISVMSNILERTAAATGVTQQEVEAALLETTLHKEEKRKEDDSESGKPTSKAEEHLPFPAPIQLGVQEVMQTECKIEPVDDEYPPKMEDNPLERESPGHCSTAEGSDMEMKIEADNDDLDDDQLTFEWWNNKTREKPSDPLDVSHIGVKIEHMDHDYKMPRKITNIKNACSRKAQKLSRKKAQESDEQIQESQGQQDELLQQNISVSMAEEYKTLKKMRAVDKRNIARLSIEQRAHFLKIRDRKEVGQFLMPDAPPSKKRRKISPVRVPCPLIPGTPEVPPPRVLQKWELNQSTLAVSGPSRVELSARDAGTPRSTLHTEPSTSSSRPEPSVYQDDLEEEIVQWQRSVDPGSEVEDDDDDDDCLRVPPGRRRAMDFALEELSSEESQVLRAIDRQDDCALMEASGEDMLVFDWSSDPEVFLGEREVFTGRAGPTFSAENMSPFEIFAKIWDEDIFNLIVEETNRYAALLLSNPSLAQSTRLKKWTPITPHELWAFFAIIMLQSFVPLPVEKEFWFPCLPYLKLGNFTDIMPHYRFLLIKRCLHFVDNSLFDARGIPTTKLSKIQPILDHLDNKFSSLYLPEQNICIDESLLLWKGNLSFSQLIATKAAQVGIKSYELCEARTGYLWKTFIYTGKSKKEEGDNVGDHAGKAEPESATSKIVLNLVSPLLNKGHTLIMDNFYNSPLLARTLKAQKTDVFGTLRLNREFVPDSLRLKCKANMRTGEVTFSHTKDLTVTVWNDANVVSLISTYHAVEVGGKEKYGYYRYKPKVVLDYNMSMGGVDKKDQLLQAFPIERVRNAIWYKKLFRRLLNVSIHNSFVIYSSGKSPMPQRKFRVALADEILQRFRPTRMARPLTVTSSTSEYHIAVKVKSNRCRCCAKKKIVNKTVYACEACKVNLCLLRCFKEYHISMGLFL